MNSYIFSIVIPTLNEENYLPILLADLKKQQTKNFEVIVVDAYSEDKTLQVAKPYASFYPFRLVQSKKRNVSHQRNLGAMKAKGKYLIFLDADAQVYSSFTKRLEKNLTLKKGLLLLPSLALASQDNTQTNKIVMNLVNSLIEASQALGKPFSSGGSFIIEKNLFHHLGGFNPDVFMSEDHNLVQKAHDAGVKPRFLKDIKVVFCLRRFSKEGQLKVFSKYFMTIMYMLMKGEVKEKIFTYNMGGQEYTKKRKKQPYESVHLPN